MSAVIALVLLGTAATASAGTDLGSSGGVSYVSNFSGVTPPGSALVDVSCPADKQPTGGGFGYSSFGMTAWSFPLGSAWRVQTHVQSGGMEDITALVMCKGGKLRVRRRDLSAKAGKAKAAKAACPGRTHVVGGGGFIQAVGSGHLNSSHPYDGPDRDRVPDDGWRVRAYNGAASSREMRVVAVCQKGTPRYRTGTYDSLPPSASAPAIADCPGAAPLMGAGIRLSGPAATGIPRAIRPLDTDDSDTVPDDRVLANAYNDSSATEPKAITAYAICKRT
jgi:hypothetical protein